MCLDVRALLDGCFAGAVFKAIHSVTIHRCCLLRSVFTMRYQPEASRTAAEDEDLALGIVDYDTFSDDTSVITDRIPKDCAFHADVQAKTVVIGRSLFQANSQRHSERNSSTTSSASSPSRQSLTNAKVRPIESVADHLLTPHPSPIARIICASL